jgi:hypothetical protein
MSPEQVSKFGANNPYKRPAQPEEIAPAMCFSLPTQTRAL